MHLIVPIPKGALIMKLDETWFPTPEAMLDIFVAWFNESVADYDVPPLDKDEAYVVWFCYTVGNAKALVSTSRHDHMYYEVTYHQNKEELYIDQYLKVSHAVIPRVG